MESDRRREYKARINRALDYIDTHLQEELTLEGIARAAFFSPFHFHRIFTALMGEPVNQFVLRVRLERAAFLLRAHPSRTVTRVAMECGYGNPAAFSRAFRAAFGTTPTAWRKCDPAGGGLEDTDGKMGTAPGKEGKDPSRNRSHSSWAEMDTPPGNQGRTAMSEELKLDVRVEALPDTTIAYIRHVGPYAGDSDLFKGLFGRLFQWAGPRGLIQPPETQTVSIYHDDPNITEEAKLRVSVGLSVPADTEVSGEVGKMTLKGGRYAQARFELQPHQYGEAWDAVYGRWLPDSGFVPGNGLAFERYLNNPEEHPEGKHVVEICVPVKPL